MGGTFDPIHLGHLRAAETAREGLGLDVVAFVPSHVPPHRRGPLSAPLDRWAMVCLATAHHPAFVPSDAELRREGPSYTVDTLAALEAERPGDELVLIVGSDTYPEMADWRDPAGIFARCLVAVVERPGAPPLPEAPPAAGARGVRRVEGPAIEVSATSIRERVRQGRSVRYLVPDTVADYIARRSLYQ
ncbi:MAG: nicotinate (nicotinamide) nucleotide adenylyltransferase [Acidobacteria bacterium]|nr:nicotinate (nicotinamide) nucleotide adenylyltransferase [Acidobacteriota bacterium]